MKKVEDKVLTMGMGPLCDSVSAQVTGQGFSIPTEDAKTLEKVRQSINLLMLQGVMTDGEVKKARGRLFKQVMQAVIPAPVGGAY